AAEARLTDVSITDVEEAARAASDVAAASVDPADDLYGSADYKREVVAVFVRRALRISAARARGAEPSARFPHAVVACGRRREDSRDRARPRPRARERRPRAAPPPAPRRP